MPKPPKRYYSDDETRNLVNEYAPYLKSVYVPAEAARGIIRALLERIPIPNLNREAAEQHLMAELLHDNRELEKARKRSEDYLQEDLSTKEAARAEELLTAVVLSGYGQKRVETVLDEYSSHSVQRMREESDKILKAIDGAPFNRVSAWSKWLDTNLPRLLQSLKQEQACFAGCKLRTEWPPKNEVERDRIVTPEFGAGPASIKDEILGYFHGLSVLRVRDYLEGNRPKTRSRSHPPS